MVLADFLYVTFQLGRELTASQKLAQLGREMSGVSSTASDAIAFPEYFTFVPWKHHVAIVSKCESVEEALFYVVKCINEGWSRNTLENCLHAHYYESCGGAITNFSEKLPSPQSEMAQEITKDTYDFGFLTLPDGYDEEKLETELEKQLTRFLLELGTGFAYLGRQKQIIVAGKTRKLDMLFFHINLNCYIVIELKTCSLPARIRRKAELLRQCRE